MQVLPVEPDGPANASRMQRLRAAPSDGIEQASDLLRRLFRSFDGSLAVRLWNGTTLQLGRHSEQGPPTQFTLVCRSPAALSSVVMGLDRLRLAEAFFNGDFDIEGDFFAALGLKDHLDSIHMSWRDRFGAVIPALRLRLINRGQAAPARRPTSLNARPVKAHSRQENSEAVRFHYDVSNEFYALWLDAAMVYSCAYFEQPGDRLLDIGCGWGALVIHAASRYGVHAHGVTLSRQQLAFAHQRISQAGVADRVTVELRDYRDLQGASVYDKVASVGMFEHVGLKNLPLYFSTVERLLKPAGLFLNHGITHEMEGWDDKTLSTEFINRYIFPDGQLDTVSNIQRGMERAGFEIADVESLRPHYARTLRHWVRRLEQHHTQALHHVGESTYRLWRLYMAACALEFESGDIGVYQLLASKRTVGLAALPLTRRHLYRAAAVSP
jgi:cyclopropane-fatty-acyl-phospholipid synthase